jgi:hypothetical protein
MFDTRTHGPDRLLFAAAGAGAATLSGMLCVEVFETGVGAVKIPLMAGMLGSMATRSCHPEFLCRMSRRASIVTEREISFRLPFLQGIEGEVVRDLERAGLADLARLSISCVRYPLGHDPTQAVRRLLGLRIPATGDGRRRDRRTARHVFVRPLRARRAGQSHSA